MTFRDGGGEDSHKDASTVSKHSSLTGHRLASPRIIQNKSELTRKQSVLAAI